MKTELLQAKKTRDFPKMVPVLAFVLVKAFVRGTNADPSRVQGAKF